MNRIETMSLTLLCLLAVGACTSPEIVSANSDQPQGKNQKLKRAERDFFDRGGSFK